MTASTHLVPRHAVPSRRLAPVATRSRGGEPFYHSLLSYRGASGASRAVFSMETHDYSCSM